MNFRFIQKERIYIVQYKFMFWWIDVKTIGEYTKEFSSLNEAKDAIESFKAYRVVVG